MMKVIAFLALCGLASAGVISAPFAHAPAALANTGTSSSSRTQDSHGNYAFAYNENHATGGTSRQEQGNALGQVVGSYSLGIVDGRQRTVNYVADAYGFRANVQTNEPGTAPTASAAVAPAAAIAAPAYGYAHSPVYAHAPAYGYAAPALSHAAPLLASPAYHSFAHGPYLG